MDPSLDCQSTLVLGLPQEGRAGAPPINPGAYDPIAVTGVRISACILGYVTTGG